MNKKNGTGAVFNYTRPLDHGASAACAHLPNCHARGIVVLASADPRMKLTVAEQVASDGFMPYSGPGL